jgi:hypothetical protein
MVDRISEIVRLQKAFDAPAAEASVIKWREAWLIWEEKNLNGGKTFQAISDAIQEHGGKGSSLGYLSRMERCWRSMIEHGMDGWKPEQLPDFNETYRSEEIQEGSPDRKRRQSRAGADTPDDHTAHGIIMGMATMVGNPAVYAPLVSDEDWAILAELPDQIRLFFRHSGQ